MSLFALITALLLEQLRPLSSRKHLYGWLSGYVDFFQQNFNAGEHRHGRIAWIITVVPLEICVILAYGMLYRMQPLFAWAFNVLVLYLTMGFRQFSHYFTDIHLALRADRLDEARELLSHWRRIDSQELSAEEVARVTIEQGLLAAQRSVFGVIAWFVLFSVLGLGGAAGALLYRLSQFLRVHWAGDGNTETDDFGRFAQLAFYLLEWLPIRLTAMTFAVVGNFEDTIHCWRTQATGWPDPEAGILLASGGGALGVRLGMPLSRNGTLEDRAELGVGEYADADFMQSAIGLVWRSVVFWLLLMLLLSLASLLA